MRKSREIAYTAILCALIAVLVMIGFVQIIPGVISVAVLPLLIVMLAPQLFGLKQGMICSGFFGVMSLINSFVQPSYLADFIHNPLVSVLPRIAVGAVVFAVFAGMNKVCGRSKSQFLREFLPSGLASALGVCTNTLLFLGMMWLLYGGSYVPSKGMTVTELIPVIIAANFVLELAVCTLLVPPLRYGVVRAMKRGGASDRSQTGRASRSQPAGSVSENSKNAAPEAECGRGLPKEKISPAPTGEDLSGGAERLLPKDGGSDGLSEGGESGAVGGPNDRDNDTGERS